MCEYTNPFGKRCREEALQGSKYCILHVDLPEDEESDEFKRINEWKEKRVKEKISNGDFNFDGAKLYKIEFSHVKVKGNLSFNEAVIREDARFRGTEIDKSALFWGAKIGKNCVFSEAKIHGVAQFSRAKIGEKVLFMEAEIGVSLTSNRFREHKQSKCFIQVHHLLWNLRDNAAPTYFKMVDLAVFV